MGFFSRKKPTVPIGPPSDTWVVVRGAHNGNPLLARVRTQLGPVVGHSAYPFRVGVATRVLQGAADGMPSAEENATLLDIEDRLATALEADRAAVFVVALTTNGVKEWVFYASDPVAVKQRMDAFLPSVRTHQLQMVIAKDEDWVVYHQFQNTK